jgi:hypothetical protein
MGSEFYEFIIKTKYKYTQKECLHLCLQKFIMENCKCYDLNYSQLKPNISACQSEEQLKCTNDEYMKFLRENKSNCIEKCPLECDQIVFNHAISSADYPTENAYQILKSNHQFSSFNNLTFENFKERSLMVNIFYSKLSYWSVSQVKKIEIIELLAKIGGLLGFFIGMSLLSFVEFLEIIIEVLLIIKSKSMFSELDL